MILKVLGTLYLVLSTLYLLLDTPSRVLLLDTSYLILTQYRMSNADRMKKWGKLAYPSAAVNRDSSFQWEINFATPFPQYIQSATFAKSCAPRQ